MQLNALRNARGSGDAGQLRRFKTHRSRATPCVDALLFAWGVRQEHPRMAWLYGQAPCPPQDISAKTSGRLAAA